MEKLPVTVIINTTNIVRMIKNVKRREECNTYLTHICRLHCSGDSMEKRSNIRRFQPTLRLSLAVEVDYVYTWWKPQFWMKAPHISSFLCAISITVMSTDVSQVGVAFFPSFNIFCHFIFPGFPFVSTNVVRRMTRK